MTFSLLDNSVKVFRYIVIWLFYATLQTVAMYGVVHLPLSVLIVDSLIHSVLYAFIMVMVWSVFEGANFDALTFYQRFINQIALAFVSIGIWLIGGYFAIDFIYGSTISVVFIPLVYVKGVLGILVYIIAVQIHNSDNQSDNAQKDPIETETTKESEISVSKECIDRVSVKSGSKIHIIQAQEIICLQADGDYVMMITQQGRFMKEQTMKFFEENLPAQQFVRVHRSCIVNVEMISNIEQYEKQNQILVLKNGLKIKTSPSGYKSLRMALNL